MRDDCAVTPLRGVGTAVAALLLGLTLGAGAAAETPHESAKPASGEGVSRRSPEEDDASERKAVMDFRRVWAKHRPVFRSRFLGVRALQNPTDAWIVQEIISEVKPDFVVEAGTFHGGSAAYWALILENVNPEGRVITIDIEDLREPEAIALPISQRRVDFLLGSSTAPEIVSEVKQRVNGKRVVVLLDSLHTKEHVAAELAAYASIVPVGSYLIVQDTGVGPLAGSIGGRAAVDEFLAANDGWIADREKERFRITNTVRGYLRRLR